MNNWTAGVTLEQVEREAILSCLRFYRGNRTYAAESLDIAIRTLRNKLELYKEQGHSVPDSEWRTPAERYEAEKKAEAEAKALEDKKSKQAKAVAKAG